MLLAQTSEGIARVGPDRLLLLDHPAPLEDFIVEGRLAELGNLHPRKEIDWPQVTMAPPVRRPGKIVVIGLNYRDHAAETGSPLPVLPRFHLIPGSAVTAAGATVRLPAAAPDRVDYEGELAVVIGRTGRDIRKSVAWDFVAGGTVANDISARDVQAGENPAVPKPLGPALLTADELRQYDALPIATEVNGVVRQRSTTVELVFSIPELLSYVSSFLTLEAGDVILTGTPAGTGVATGQFLAAGDVVSVAIGTIGTLTNTIAAPRPGIAREAV